MTEEQRQALDVLYRRVDERVSAIVASRGGWPCRKGCDHCCRHLAAPLPITRLEWTYLQEGFQALPPETQADIRARIHAMADTQRPFTCPFLSLESGGCREYAHRPLACRTYGFYLSRGEGNWCQLIQGLLEQQGDGDIVWGNQEALEETVRRLSGPTRPLPEWFTSEVARHEDT